MLRDGRWQRRGRGTIWSDARSSWFVQTSNTQWWCARQGARQSDAVLKFWNDILWAWFPAVDPHVSKNTRREKTHLLARGPDPGPMGGKGKAFSRHYGYATEESMHLRTGKPTKGGNHTEHFRSAIWGLLAHRQSIFTLNLTARMLFSYVVAASQIIPKGELLDVP